MPHSIYTKAWLKKEQVTICWTICSIQVPFFIYGHWDMNFHKKKKCSVSSESPNKYLAPSNATLSLVQIVVSGQNFGCAQIWACYVLEDWGHVFKQQFECWVSYLRASAISASLLAMAVAHHLGREPLWEKAALFELWDWGHVQKQWVLPLHPGVLPV